MLHVWNILSLTIETMMNWLSSLHLHTFDSTRAVHLHMMRAASPINKAHRNVETLRKQEEANSQHADNNDNAEDEKNNTNDSPKAHSTQNQDTEVGAA